MSTKENNKYETLIKELAYDPKEDKIHYSNDLEMDLL